MQEIKDPEREDQNFFKKIFLSKDQVLIEDVPVRETFYMNKHAQIHHSWWNMKTKKTLEWHLLMKGGQYKMEKKSKSGS